MSDDEVSSGPGGVVRIVRLVAPWVALVVVVWVLSGIMSDFGRTKTAMTVLAQGSAGSASETSTAPSVVTTVTGLIATVRSDVPLRSQPATSAAGIIMAQQGSVLSILAKQGTWFRVKDGAGHLGWIPNNTKYIAVSAKPKAKSKKKK